MTRDLSLRVTGAGRLENGDRDAITGWRLPHSYQDLIGARLADTRTAQVLYRICPAFSKLDPREN